MVEAVTADTEALQAAATPIADAAKASFDLREALAEVKLTERKVVVFRDENTVTAFAAREREVAMLEQHLGDQELSVEDREQFSDRLDVVAAELEAARAAMLASALSVHMHAVPDVVMAAGRRHARKAYGVNGKVPDEDLEDANQAQQAYVLGRVISKIVNSAGALAVFDRDQVGSWLRESLPLSQWQRIVVAYNDLMFTDSIGAQATLDPGF